MPSDSADPIPVGHNSYAIEGVPSASLVAMPAGRSSYIRVGPLNVSLELIEDGETERPVAASYAFQLDILRVDEASANNNPMPHVPAAVSDVSATEIR